MKTRFLQLTIAILIFSASGVSGQSQEKTEAKILSMPEYVIPPEAAAAGIDGQLLVAVSVGKNGSVERALVVGGPSWPCGSNPRNEVEQVREGIKETAMKAKFLPPIKDGEPQTADLLMTVLIGKRLEEYKRRLASARQMLEEGGPRIIKGGVINGKALQLVKPSYPPEARANRVSGMVEIEVIVDENGKVLEAGAVRGNPLLQTTAREAACLSRFSPTVLEGHRVQVSGIITYNFAP